MVVIVREIPEKIQGNRSVGEKSFHLASLMNHLMSFQKVTPHIFRQTKVQNKQTKGQFIFPFLGGKIRYTQVSSPP